MARLFGIDFFSTLTRGSQFRVESVLFRVAKPLGYIIPSAQRDQVKKQPAMEVTPLILEPESRLYTSPVLVLDYRSLYPSVMIANNLCYTTCLGRMKGNIISPLLTTDIDTNKVFSNNNNTNSSSNNFLSNNINNNTSLNNIINNEFIDGLGISKTYRPNLNGIKNNANDIYIAPTGTTFVPKSQKEGILPIMLREILDTRVMIKKAMIDAKNDNDKVLYRVLNARQFGLKMIANVTYGYTAASFSGRLPCAELADSIVSTGRDALEQAILLIKNSDEFKPAEVVYGDTDSLFVHLPGKSLEDAFKIGNEISNKVSKLFLSPMKLQFEKVYLPCVLQVKKRYCGFRYENLYEVKNNKPHLESKGIETVRRDGCEALIKIMEKSLRILFSTLDISLVKKYLQNQFVKMISGRISNHDFILSGKVKLGSYAAERKDNKSKYNII